MEVHECCLWRIANFLSILKFATHTLLTTQRAALRALGLAGRRPPLSWAERDPAGYLSALRAAAEEAELTEATGLGGFSWLVQAVRVPLPRPLLNLLPGAHPPPDSAHPPPDSAHAPLAAGRARS